MIQLVNQQASPCSVRGFPAATFFDVRQRVIPFSLADHGYFRPQQPQWVNLPPDARAFVQIAKYRCDTRQYAEAVRVSLQIPGGAVLAIGIPGYVDFAYCGPRDPGSIVDLSPVVSTESELAS